MPMFTRTLRVQVGNYTAEADFWGHVEDITAPQATYSSAISNGSSDLGGQVLKMNSSVCSAVASASRGAKAPLSWRSYD